jgi:hypothetical protein
MTDEELRDLLERVRTGPKLEETKLDLAVPLPVGTKTVTGFLGALFSGTFAVITANPEILNFARDWKSATAAGLALLFTALAGVGGISKWQRQLNASQQAVDILQQVLKRLQEQRNG